MNLCNNLPWKRNVLFCGLIACIALLVASCSSSDNSGDNSAEKKNYTLTASWFPEDCEGCSLVVQSLKKVDGDWIALDEYNLGTVGPTTTLTKTVGIDESATLIGFYIIDPPRTEKYFFTVSTSNILAVSLSTCYWVDYDYYLNYHRVRYGINRSAIKPLPLDVSQTFDFKDAPYYLFKQDSATGRTFRITVNQTLETTLVWSANELSFLAEHSARCYSTTANQSVNDLSPVVDPLYLLVAPKDTQVSTRATVLVNDLTSTKANLKQRSFEVTNALTLDGDAIYLIDIDNSYNVTATEAKILKKWTISTDVIEDVHTFDSPVTAWVLDGTTLYIAAGLKVFRIDLTTNQTALVANMATTVRSLTLVGDLLLVYDGRYRLVQKSDGSVQASSAAIYGGKTTIWVPSQKRIYFYCDGSWPNDICFLNLDPDTKIFGSDGDSPYHGDYSFSYPLLQLGSSLLLVTGNGNVFSINDSSASKIVYQNSLGYPIYDICVEPDRIEILVNSVSSTGAFEGCRVITLSSASPYGEISRTNLMTKESGIALLRSSAGLIVVTRSCENMKIGSDYYNPVRIRKLSDADLAGTTSVANRFLSTGSSHSWTFADGPARPVRLYLE